MIHEDICLTLQIAAIVSGVSGIGRVGLTFCPGKYDPYGMSGAWDRDLALDLDTIRDITSRLGLADVREFGLTWEDCEGFLSRLGYRTTVDVVQAS